MLQTTLKTQPSTAEILLAKIGAGTAEVGVIGMGIVGLRLAIEKAKAGFIVRGYDRNPIRVDQVNHGLNYIRGIADADVADVVYNGKFSASIDFASLHERDVIVICVRTPLTPSKDPDVSNIQSVGSEIAKHLRVGQLICLVGTAYPGTTEDVLLPLLRQSGLQPGTDFFVAFSPERVEAPSKRHAIREKTTLVGGATPACLEVAAAFFAETSRTVLNVSSPRVAEMTKVFEDTFAAVNAAMVNEMAMLCDKLGMNVWEVVAAASTQRLAAARVDPSPGVGGHDTPLGPFYLAWLAREADSPTSFIELAGEINLSMPYYVRAKISKALNKAGRPMKNANVLVIGVAYDRDIADVCESPSLKVIELLDRDGANVSYHDPFIARFEDGRRQRRSVALTVKVLSNADCVAILTDHTPIDWEFVVRHANCIVDTRNATRLVLSRPNVTLL